MTIHELITFSILGLGSGAIYAALGVGVVLTYRASGLVNFAHGAMALYTVVLMAELQTTGQLVLPVGSIGLGEDLPFIAVLLLALGYSVLQSTALYLLVFSPLHNAPALAKVVASVGLMLALQALIVLRFGSRPRSLSPILPNEPVEVLGATVARDRLYLAGIVVLGSAVLALWTTRTVFGKATRAAAEDERGAYLVGLHPQRIALVNWVVAGVMATLIGILMAPLTSLDATSFTLLIVPALAAALLGRLTSLMVTAAAGLGVGALQSVLLLLVQKNSWLPQIGLKESLPFIVVAIVMFLGGRNLPDRGTLVAQRLPAAPGARISPPVAAVVLLAAAAGVFLLPTAWTLALITTMSAAILCLGLVVLTGFVGQVSLAHMTLAGVAGFSLSKLATDAGIPFPIAPLLAVAVTTVVGVVLGAPALRVRGMHLAVVSIAAAVVIEEFVFKNPDYTGGFGGSTVEQPQLLGLDLGIRGGVADFPRPAFGLLVLLCLISCSALVVWLRGSDLGRQMLAVRADERAATAAGISVVRVRLIAIAVSSALAGVGGCLFGYQFGQLSFGSFGVFTSLMVLTVAYLGGIGSVTGAMFGGALYSGGLVATALDKWLSLGRYEAVILGIGVVVAAIANPDGLTGGMHTLRHLRSPDPEAPAEARVDNAEHIETVPATVRSTP